MTTRILFGQTQMDRKALQHSVTFSRESEESYEHHKIGDIVLSNLLQMKVKYF